MAFGQRIAYIIETLGISKAWVAERLGVSKQALNYLLKHSIKPKFVDEFAELLGLDPQWIEHGAGTPSLKENRPVKRTNLPVLTSAMLLGPEGMHSGKSEIEFSHHPAETYTAYKLVDGQNICFKASNPQHKLFINPQATILGVLVEARYLV